VTSQAVISSFYGQIKNTIVENFTFLCEKEPFIPGEAPSRIHGKLPPRFGVYHFSSAAVKNLCQILWKLKEKGKS